MASWRKIENGKISLNPLDETELNPDDMVSYFNHLKGITGSFGTVVRYSYLSAKGTAYYLASVPEIAYEIRINGKYKDVVVVIKKFENFFGAMDFNPRLELPDNLKTPFERIKYLINWIKGGSEDKTEE